jgi:ABC-type uncharacterized transport system permease subunit
MERWMLAASTLLALIAAIAGMRSVHRGHRSRWTVVWLAGVFVCQLGFLWLRGQQRQACPLSDLGEILAFLSWSLTLFYLLVGPTYRISLLGVFTAPVVVVFQSLALMPGFLAVDPQASKTANPWHEIHSATSVLAYGALALAAVAGVMFLVLDRQLKEHHLKSGLFRNLPPIRELLISMNRLVGVGLLLLTIGVIAGFRMPHTADATSHLVAALGTWLAYVVLWTVHRTRGLTGRRFSFAAVVLFLLSLAVFALL